MKKIRSKENSEGKKRRKKQDTTRWRKRYRKASKDWKQELIDKSSLTYICTSEYRYKPKASMVLV